MAKPIEVTDNIKECVDIIEDYLNKGGTHDEETAKNAIKYLKLTTNNALSGGLEPRGCPNPRRIEKVK